MDARTVFHELVSEAVCLLEHNRTDDEILVIKTATGNVYHQVLHCIGAVRCVGFPVEPSSYEAEVRKFLSILHEKNDTHVQYIVAVVNDHVVQSLDRAPYSVELPPYCIRKGLMELNQRNADAIILTDGIRDMKIVDSMLPQKQV